MEIKVYATLREIVGGQSVQLEDILQVTVGQLVELLITRYPLLEAKLRNNQGEWHSAFHILINGRDARYLDGFDTVITPSDEVRIFPPVGGGA